MEAPAHPHPAQASASPGALENLLADMADDSGARVLALTDDAGILLSSTGSMAVGVVEPMAVLAVSAFLAAREVARLAGLGAPAEYWQRALCGGYGVLAIGTRHRLVVVHDSAHAEGAVAFALRRHLPVLNGILATRATEHPSLPMVPKPFAEETGQDALRFAGKESSWKDGLAG